MAVTKNEALTHETTSCPVTDLFFVIGASRNKDISKMFKAALESDEDLAVRCLAYARDVRAGMGERKTFRDLLKYLEKNRPDLAKQMLSHVPELGRWDDLLVLQSDDLKNIAQDMIGKALLDGDGLCAKWMPRQGEKAAELRAALGMTPKQWRKTLVNLSKTVEQQMCAKEWGKINFNHVPSVAMSRYRKAFFKHDPDRFREWVDDVKKELTRNVKTAPVKSAPKVNVKAVFPHDILKPAFRRDTDMKDMVQNQWDSLESQMDNRSIIPIIDVSPSMTSFLPGVLTSYREVAIGLGLYCASKQEGAFKDVVLPFSGTSKLFKVDSSDVYDAVQVIQSADWKMSTNLQAAFREILQHAILHKVKQEDLPNTLLILSDMEFDRSGANQTNFETAKKAFEAHGYSLPRVVFWNLNGRQGNNPVKFDTHGTALISGYSPNVMKSIMEGNIVTPRQIMLNTLMKERYDIITI